MQSFKKKLQLFPTHSIKLTRDFRIVRLQTNKIFTNSFHEIHEIPMSFLLRACVIL